MNGRLSKKLRKLALRDSKEHYGKFVKGLFALPLHSRTVKAKAETKPTPTGVGVEAVVINACGGCCSNNSLFQED